MHRHHLLRFVAISSSSLSILFTVFLALESMAGFAGAGVVAFAAAIALALSLEAAKFCFASEAAGRYAIKQVRTAMCTGAVAALLVLLSTVATVRYIKTIEAKMVAEEEHEMKKQQSLFVQQSAAVNRANVELTGLEREREIIRSQIASSQDAVDRDLRNGMRGRAIQSMAQVERLKRELSLLDTRELVALDAKKRAESEAASLATLGVKKAPTQSSATALGVMLEVVSMLSVVLVSLQKQQKAEEILKSEPVQRTLEVVRAQVLADVPEEVLHMEKPSSRRIQKLVGCSYATALEYARRMRQVSSIAA